jgi:hypothetical protein
MITLIIDYNNITRVMTQPIQQVKKKNKNL